jgi:hypothetical protein
MEVPMKKKCVSRAIVSFFTATAFGFSSGAFAVAGEDGNPQMEEPVQQGLPAEQSEQPVQQSEPAVQSEPAQQVEQPAQQVEQTVQGEPIAQQTVQAEQQPQVTQQVAQQPSFQAVMIRVPVNSAGNEQRDLAEARLVASHPNNSPHVNQLSVIWQYGQTVDNLDGSADEDHRHWRGGGWARPYWYGGYRPYYRWNNYRWGFGRPYYYNYPDGFYRGGYPYWGYRYYYYPLIRW